MYVIINAIPVSNTMLKIKPENRRIEVLDNDGESFRLYNCAENIDDKPLLLPSVTTILSKTKSDADHKFLKKWQNNNKDKSKMYLEDGTLMHLVYEYVNSKKFDLRFNGHLSDIPKVEDMSRRQKRLISNFRELNDKIVELESQETFTYFNDNCIGWAGSYDGKGFVKFGNEVHRCIIDFKTSENPKIDKYVHDYKIQLLAYIVAENSKYPLHQIRNGVIMISVNSDEIRNQMFHVNNEILMALYPEWISRVHKFNNRYKHIIEKGYNQLVLK